MAMIDKEKLADGVDKAVDVANDVADKTGKFIKEKEIDKKAKKAVNIMGKGIAKFGSMMENAFKEEEKKTEENKSEENGTEENKSNE